MPSVRIQGVVRLANAVRQGLSGPVSAARTDQFRRVVANGIQQVESILAKHRATAEALPAQTRRAYQFLKAVDFDSVAGGGGKDAEPVPRRIVRFKGLALSWDTILNSLGRPQDDAEVDACHTRICSLRQVIEEPLKTGKIRLNELPDRTRAVRGWLAFFAQREHLDLYSVAVAKAKPIFESSLQQSDTFRLPATICFKLTSTAYQLKQEPNGTRVILPTPMITFDGDLFHWLADFPSLGGVAKRAILDAMAGEAYQVVEAELELSGGAENQAAGVHHDLVAAFERVVHRYCDGTMPQPRLVWSRAFTSRQFSYYDRVSDTLMVSRALDRPDVPGYVVDFVVYHELLHKSIRADRHNGCLTSHSPEFHEQERRFEQHSEAEALLGRFVTRR